MRVEVSTVIDRPVEAVFKFSGTDHFQNHPRWDPAVLKLEPITAGPIRLGSRFKMTRVLMRREQTDVFEVVEWKEPTHLTIATRSPGFKLSISSVYEPVGDNKTHLKLVGDAELGGLRALFAPVMKGQVTRHSKGNLARIKAMVEAES